MRYVENPPNPWLTHSVEWIGEPPEVKLEVFEETETRKIITHYIQLLQRLIFQKKNLCKILFKLFNLLEVKQKISLIFVKPRESDRRCDTESLR